MTSTHAAQNSPTDAFIVDTINGYFMTIDLYLQLCQTLIEFLKSLRSAYSSVSFLETNFSDKPKVQEYKRKRENTCIVLQTAIREGESIVVAINFLKHMGTSSLLSREASAFVADTLARAKRFSDRNNYPGKECTEELLALSNALVDELAKEVDERSGATPGVKRHPFVLCGVD
jgi:hypothetical protein